MSDYYLGVDRDGNIIMHSKGAWKKHKYIQKIGEGANAVYKYAREKVTGENAKREYLEAENEHVQANNQTIVQNNIINNVFDRKSENYKIGKKYVENFHNKRFLKEYEMNEKKKAYIKTGRGFVENLLNKIGVSNSLNESSRWERKGQGGTYIKKNNSKR